MTEHERTYLDYASATPIHSDVHAAMEPYLAGDFGNPSALHAEGRRVHDAIARVRTTLARLLVVRPEGITFTSGGTEANALAVFGVVDAAARRAAAAGLSHADSYATCEVITLPTEHPSILEAVRALATRGVVVRYAPVREDGRIDMEAFREILSPRTCLVTVAYANSETGVVQDIRDIVRAVRSVERAHQVRIVTHTDACQAPLWLPLGMDALGVDMMTLDAGKCYGPKGSGVLARVHGVMLEHQTYGGLQEGGLRAGTENVAGIVGAVAAYVRAQGAHTTRAAAVGALRDRALHALLQAFPDAVCNGSTEHRTANNINISFPGMDTEYAAMYLDARGIAVSTRSACGAADVRGSHVVRAMTGDEARSMSTLRITLGEDTTEQGIAACIDALRAWHACMARA